MNWKQIVIMWCGIGIIVFIGIVTVMDSYEPDYELFVFWLLLVMMVTVGFIMTFRTKKNKKNGSREMNLRKGFKRLVSILSLIPALVGLGIIIVGCVNGDDDMVTGGILTALIGFVSIWAIYGIVRWAIYGIVRYIIKGFNENCCANCEREIGELEQVSKFNEHKVCGECYKKLNENS